MRISDVRLCPAPPRDAKAGLMGFITFMIDNRLRVDGVVLRRTLDGRLTLSFPSRRDRKGGEHPYLQPLDDEARCDLEQQVLDALGLTEETAP